MAETEKVRSLVPVKVPLVALVRVAEPVPLSFCTTGFWYPGATAKVKMPVPPEGKLYAVWAMLTPVPAVKVAV